MVDHQTASKLYGKRDRRVLSLSSLRECSSRAGNEPKTPPILSNVVVERLISEVGEARSRMLDAVRSLSAEQCEAKPSTEEWSVAEVLEHLVLSEELGIVKLWEAVDKIGTHKSPCCSSLLGKGRQSKEVEEAIADLWLENNIAPGALAPRLHGPKDYWVKRFQSCNFLLHALGARLRDRDLETIAFPYFSLGPLSARQRLQFLRFHIDHHIWQVFRIQEKLGAKPPRRPSKYAFLLESKSDEIRREEASVETMISQAIAAEIEVKQNVTVESQAEHACAAVGPKQESESDEIAAL